MELRGIEKIQAHHGNRSAATIRNWIVCWNYPAVKVDGVWIADTELSDLWRQYVIVEKKPMPEELVKDFFLKKYKVYFGALGVTSKEPEKLHKRGAKK